MFWNVRRLGNPTKQCMVIEVLRNNKINVVCLEETKLMNPSNRVLHSVVPYASFSFLYKNTRGASEGIIIGVDNKVQILYSWEGIFSLSIKVETDI